MSDLTYLNQETWLIDELRVQSGLVRLWITGKFTTATLLCWLKSFTNDAIDSNSNSGDNSIDKYNRSVVKVVLWSRGGGSPDEARLEQTPYPFQPH